MAFFKASAYVKHLEGKIKYFLSKIYLYYFIKIDVYSRHFSCFSQFHCHHFFRSFRRNSFRWLCSLLYLQQSSSCSRPFKSKKDMGRIQTQCYYPRKLHQQLQWAYYPLCFCRWFFYCLCERCINFIQIWLEYNAFNNNPTFFKHTQHMWIEYFQNLCCGYSSWRTVALLSNYSKYRLHKLWLFFFWHQYL